MKSASGIEGLEKILGLKLPDDTTIDLIVRSRDLKAPIIGTISRHGDHLDAIQNTRFNSVACW